METILLDVTANQHLPNYIARYDAINKSRNPWPEVLCKYELLNFKVLKIERNATWVKSEKAISVIFVFDLRKGGALIFTWKRSFWM